MNRASRRTEGFTLIELLVVIAILALLIAVLLPTLGQARAVADFTVCRANMRSAGTAWNGYVTTHEGRYPGFAESSVEYWGPVWMNLLNREWYHNNDPSYYPRSAYGDEPTVGPLVRFWDFWNTDGTTSPETALLHKKWLACTEYKAWGSLSTANNRWSRPWIANDWAVGGHYRGTGWYDPSVYGQIFYNCQKVLPNPQSINPAYTYYQLGAKTDQFAAPSNKWLMWEAEAGNDMDRWQTANLPGNGTVLLNGADGTKAPWVSSTGTSGQFAFRHLKPRDRRLYQAMLRSCILYMDGHVGPWNPNVDMYRSQCFWDN